jgi:two-component system response regulator FlrC
MASGLPILVVEDDLALREAVCDTLELAGQAVVAAAGGEEALQLLARQTVSLVVSDVRMLPIDGIALLKEIRSRFPHLPVVLMTAFADVDRAVEAMRAGACDFLLKPFEPKALLDHVQRYRLPEVLDDWVIASDPVSRNLFALATRVAQSDTTVLLTGESGVGKEVVARFIHQHSTRRKGPFVAINCAAIPDSLLESTLFGHEKGAFSGAQHAQAGKFEQAQQGTLVARRDHRDAARAAGQAAARVTGARSRAGRWAEAGPSISASSRRRIGTWPTLSPRACFVRTCSIGSTSSRC